MRVPSGELKSQYLRMKGEIDAAIQEVLDAGWFVLGRQGTAFEAEFAQYFDVPHVVGVGSGTEALHLALLACGVGRGDEVITVPTTAQATVSAIQFAGATPVFADIDPHTFTMDPASAAARVTSRTRLLLPVHLYGHPADVPALAELAGRHGLALIEDCAQSHGARCRGQLTGTFGEAGCFSFYPTKNLGAFGDAGAVITRDAKRAERLRMLRNYGERPDQRYHHAVQGFNSRLDELQAAILRVKLRHLDADNERRREIAAWYAAHLNNSCLVLPAEQPWAHHVYHLYVVRTRHRDALREHLARWEVGTQIHYPVPLHLQEANAYLGVPAGSCPEAESAASELLSLPIYPELTDEQLRHVAAAVNAFEPLQKGSTEHAARSTQQG
jgi:dTDP-4-amino-4,6-dideoxygalactose transaminase